jgi:hypothetical protein
MLTGTTTTFFRGTTIVFQTTFYDSNGAPTLPAAAQINVISPSADETTQVTQLINMTPPSSGFVWTASWDTRGVGTGTVSWSVHSVEPAIPYAVGDGQLTLTANNANLTTF